MTTYELYINDILVVKNGIWTITMSYYKQFMNC